ncbi:flavodoxin family protein [Streptomyces sp. NPDC001691]|uniref:flavodoxin family protein n=1 Tax=unclassified Streptomyces TaxID=2593676 RepID=UPI000DEB18FD|nr:flavodoxin family protein [Streptomyces sp. SDr-06]RCH68959.1 flavodoxin [Streptomyces sp. SDr-06]
MKAMIVSVSVSHGNTKRVADVMGQVLEATVVTPEEVDPAELASCDLVGFGSGIFLMAFHPRLVEFIRSLPREQRGKAFVFSTSGLPETPLRPFTRPLLQLLEQKGFEAVDAFSCRALDTWFPFKPIGGIRKNRPNADDLMAARTFAEGLRARVEATPRRA